MAHGIDAKRKPTHIVILFSTSCLTIDAATDFPYCVGLRVPTMPMQWRKKESSRPFTYKTGGGASISRRSGGYASSDWVKTKMPCFRALSIMAVLLQIVCPVFQFRKQGSNLPPIALGLPGIVAKHCRGRTILLIRLFTLTGPRPFIVLRASHASRFSSLFSICDENNLWPTCPCAHRP